MKDFFISRDALNEIEKVANEQPAMQGESAWEMSRKYERIMKILSECEVREK